MRFMVKLLTKLKVKLVIFFGDEIDDEVADGVAVELDNEVREEVTNCTSDTAYGQGSYKGEDDVGNEISVAVDAGFGYAYYAELRTKGKEQKEHSMVYKRILRCNISHLPSAVSPILHIVISYPEHVRQGSLEH